MWLSALLGIGGSVIQGREQAKAQRYAADKAAETFERGVQRVQTDTGLRDTSRLGADARNQIAALLGVGAQPQVGDGYAGPYEQPSTQRPEAFQNFLNSTGYQTQLASGIDALNANAAARGMLKSGSTLKATQRYGAGLGQQYFNNYLSSLGGIANSGMTADAALANAYTGAASNAGQALQTGYGDAANTTGQMWADITTNAVGGLQDYLNNRPPKVQPSPSPLPSTPTYGGPATAAPFPTPTVASPVMPPVMNYSVRQRNTNG